MTTTCKDIAASLLGSGPGLLDPAPHALVRVHGADAIDFVQRLCSQDLASMAPGEARPGAFLDGKGRLQEHGTVLRGEGEVVLETGRERAASLAALLDRYHFGEKLAIEAVEGRCVFWAGLEPGDVPAGRWERCDGAIRVGEHRGPFFTVCSHGPGPAPSTGRPLDDDEGEALRILSCRPRLGVDTGERTLGPEVLGPDTLLVSEGKGCYIGQEIVARIRTYGKVNRVLCLLWLGDVPAPAPGTPLFASGDGDAPAGHLHSTAPVPGGRIALALVARVHAAPSRVLHLGEPGATDVEVLASPCIPGESEESG